VKIPFDWPVYRRLEELLEYQGKVRSVENAMARAVCTLNLRYVISVYDLS